MNPTDVFNGAALCCNCLLFLFLGLILVLWVLAPRVEGTYKERPQRHRAEHARLAVPRRTRQPAPPPPKAPRPARPPRVRRTPETTADLSTILAEAQRAAEAIDDIQIAMPTIPEYSVEVKMPEEWASIMEAPRTETAEAGPAPAAGETAGGLGLAAIEAGARAAVERVAQRAEQRVPAAAPVTRRVKEAAREAPSPLSAPTLADGIEMILQDLLRREAQHLQGVIHVEPTREGGVKIKVADNFYFSVAEMPEGRAKQLLQQAVRTWNELWQSQAQPTARKRQG